MIMPKVHEMVGTIKSAFSSRINELGWIEDSYSKEAIQNKISKTKVFVGFPDYILEPNSNHLQKLYANFEVSGNDFLGNIVSLQYQRKYYLKKHFYIRLLLLPLC